eukprot:TCONS_00059757-protein
MFPPSKKVADDINLERCMRIYPHLQNTGGFFIAVLEKKNDLPWQKSKRVWKSLPWDECNTKESKLDESEAKSTEQVAENTEETITVEASEDENRGEETASDDEPASKQPCIDEESLNKPDESLNKDGESQPTKVKRGAIKEDPYIFLDDSDKDLSDIRKFYGLSPELPSKQFLVRSTGAIKKRHIYLVSEKVHQVMSENKHLKIINTGVKIVTRSPFRAGQAEHGVEFRLVQDGLQLVEKFLKNRIVPIRSGDLVNLISNFEAKTAGFDLETQATMEKIDMGCVVWHLDTSKTKEGEISLSSDLFLCGHMGRNAVQVMLNKEDRRHYLRLLGVPIPEELGRVVKGPSWGDQPAKENQQGENTDEKPKDVLEEQKAPAEVAL